jgi:glycosyltransferase involved in cell wall biosynthesis
LSPSEAGFALVSGDFVKTGGMDRANYALASYLARQGRAVHLVAHRADEDLLSQGPVTFHRVPKPLNSYWLGEPLLDRAGRRWASRVAAAGGRVVVNGGNCLWGDVNWVHYVHAAWPPRGAGGPLRRLKRQYSHRTALAAERKALSRARVVVANSDQTRAVLLDRLGLAPERVHTVYYGTDPARFRPATATERIEARARLGWNHDRPVVAFVGALGDLRKGLDIVLAAWRRLSKRSDWDARLVVIGTGSALASLRDEARGRAGAVEFLGFRRDVPDLLRACDALVSPTRYEAYGLNVHEALCCGLPALVSASAGVAERYPAELSGLLIPDPEDPADLAARLRAWRDDRAGIAGAVASFSERLRTTTWDDMAGRFLQIIGSAYSGSPIRGPSGKIAS